MQLCNEFFSVMLSAACAAIAPSSKAAAILAVVGFYGLAVLWDTPTMKSLSVFPCIACM
jgi:hypothetical protein